MPVAPPKNCTKTPNCTGVVIDGGCTKCGRQKRSGNRKSSNDRGYGYGWQQLRKRYVKANPICVDPFGLHPLQHKYTQEVDHIIPKFRGGGNEDSNLQGLCSDCHKYKTMTETTGKTRYRSLSNKCIIIAGPPGAGKTTLVMDQKGWTDVVLDLDLIFQAISGLPIYHKPTELLPVALTAYDSILFKLSMDNKVGTVWVITSENHGDRLLQMKADLGATLWMVVPDITVTLNQIRQDARRPAPHEWEKIVNKWYDDYRPVPEG